MFVFSESSAVKYSLVHEFVKSSAKVLRDERNPDQEYSYVYPAAKWRRFVRKKLKLRMQRY